MAMYSMSTELLKLAGAKIEEITKVCPQCKVPLKRLDLENKECSQCKCDLTRGKEETPDDESATAQASAMLTKTSGQGLWRLTRAPRDPLYKVKTLLKGVGALGVGATGGAMMAKTSGVRFGNPILRLRRRSSGSPSTLLEHLLQNPRLRRK